MVQRQCHWIATIQGYMRTYMNVFIEYYYQLQGLGVHPILGTTCPCLHMPNPTSSCMKCPDQLPTAAVMHSLDAMQPNS